MFKWIRLLATCGPKIIIDYFRWMRKYSKHPEKYPLELRYKTVREEILFFMKHLRIDLDAKNIEAIEKNEGPYLMVSNHLAMVDTLMAIALSEKPVSFVAKIELTHTPFIGRVLKAIDCVFLDRGNLRQNLEALGVVEERLKQGYCSYIIYPEGTRQKNPRENMKPFHPGSIKMAVKANVPLIAMAEYGTFRPFGGKHDYRANLIQMHYFDPISPEEIKEQGVADFALSLQNKLQSEIDAERDVDDAYILPKKYIQKLPKPNWAEVALNKSKAKK